MKRETLKQISKISLVIALISLMMSVFFYPVIFAYTASLFAISSSVIEIYTSRIKDCGTFDWKGDHNAIQEDEQEKPQEDE